MAYTRMWNRAYSQHGLTWHHPKPDLTSTAAASADSIEFGLYTPNGCDETSFYSRILHFLYRKLSNSNRSVNTEGSESIGRTQVPYMRGFNGSKAGTARCEQR